jgi:hypothetical protein
MTSIGEEQIVDLDLQVWHSTHMKTFPFQLKDYIVYIEPLQEPRTFVKVATNPI